MKKKQKGSKRKKSGIVKVLESVTQPQPQNAHQNATVSTVFATGPTLRCLALLKIYPGL